MTELISISILACFMAYFEIVAYKQSKQRNSILNQCQSQLDKFVNVMQKNGYHKK